MRTAGYALLGFLIGAAAGFFLALSFVILWFDVLKIGDRGGDSMSGLATYLVLMPVLTLGGGITGAIWLRRKAGRGGLSPALIGIVLLAFLALLGFSVFGGVFW